MPQSFYSIFVVLVQSLKSDRLPPHSVLLELSENLAETVKNGLEENNKTYIEP